MIIVNGIWIISVIVTVVNAKQTGEEVERRGGDTQKMEEDLKTSTGMLLWYVWCGQWTFTHVFF